VPAFTSLLASEETSRSGRLATRRPTPLVVSLRGIAVDKVSSAVGPPRDSQPRHWRFLLPSNRRWLLWSALLMPVLFLVGIAVFYHEIRHVEDPAGRFEYQALDKAARSSRISVRPDTAAPSPLPPTSISLKLIEVPKPELASQFLRTWRFAGPNICGALREAGIEMSEWKAASMRNRSYECYFQRIHERDEVRPLSSTFVRVRGNERGDIVEIRAKIVGPQTDAQGRLAPAVLRIFEIIVKQACWRDFEDALASIQSLRNVEYEQFGAYLSFTREAGSENSFNFILGLKATSSSQVRTKAYFSADSWLATTKPRIPQTLSSSTASSHPQPPLALNDGVSSGHNSRSIWNCG